MTATVHVAGELLMLDPAGAAFWPARSLLAVADMHLEKGSAAALNGSLLPPWDTRATLDILAALVRRYRPARVVALGDSFHDAKGGARLLAADRTRLAAIAASVAFVWVLGNHDPVPQGVAGETVSEWTEGPLRFRHIAAPGRASGELSGHFHPKATVPVRGTVVTRPCFVADARRLMLPALGAYAGGLDVGHGEIRRLFPDGGRAFLLGRERLFGFALGGGAVPRAAVGQV
jgi:DNA ligase-associated metallophosphoesterase